MENSAFKRGGRAARLWLRLSKCAITANRFCIEWTVKRGLPTFLGRLPVPLACFATLSAALACGLIFGSIAIIGGLFIYMLCNIAIAKSSDETSIFEKSESYGGSEYRNGANGYGYYSESRDGTSMSYKVDIEDDD
jgi:hypothetical protein